MSAKINKKLTCTYRQLSKATICTDCLLLMPAKSYHYRYLITAGRDITLCPVCYDARLQEQRNEDYITDGVFGVCGMLEGEL